MDIFLNIFEQVIDLWKTHFNIFGYNISFWEVTLFLAFCSLVIALIKGVFR
jgi:hypothetical protein